MPMAYKLSPLKLSLLIIVGFIIIGFIGGAIAQPTAFCTQMACSCQDSQETPCNSCGKGDLVFATGLFNVVYSCQGKEILICENSVQVDRRIDYEPCRYKISILGY